VAELGVPRPKALSFPLELLILLQAVSDQDQDQVREQEKSKGSPDIRDWAGSSACTAQLNLANIATGYIH